MAAIFLVNEISFGNARQLWDIFFPSTFWKELSKVYYHLVTAMEEKPNISSANRHFEGYSF